MKLNVQTGLPHPSLFPLEKAKFDCLAPSAALSSNGHLERSEDELLELTLGRGASPGDLDLTQFLQYGTETVSEFPQGLASHSNSVAQALELAMRI